MVRLRDIVDSLDRTPREISGKSIAKSQGLSLMDAPKVNVDRMTCEVIVCTDIVDYQQDVILGSGVSTANHQGNPQVWFEHGEDDLYSLTLALSEDDDENYTVTKPDDFTIMGISHFAKPAIQFPIVNQLFGLIDLGVLRAVSIHVQPNPGGLSTYADRETGHKYQVTEDSHLIEYSHCKVGVNPEALKKALRFSSKYNPSVSAELIRAVELQADAASRVINSRQINNELLLPSIKKSLSAMVRTGSSMTLLTGEAQPMATKKKSMTAKELVGLSPEEIKRLASDEKLFGEYDSPSKARIKSMFTKVMEDNTPSEEDDEEAEPADDSDKDDNAEGASKKGESKDKIFAKPEEDKEKCEGCDKEEASEDQEKSKGDEEEEPVHHSENIEKKETEAEPSSSEESDDDKDEPLKPQAKSDGKPLGQQVLAEACDALKYWIEVVEDSMNPVEKPGVVDGMGEVLSQAKALSDAMDGIHTTEYGSPFEKKKDDDDDKEKEEDETAKSQLKSFLSQRRNQVETFRLIGLVNQARRLSDPEVPIENVRKSLAYVASGFADVIAKSDKSRSESITREQYDAVVAERDQAVESQKKAVKQRDALIERTEKLMKEALPAS